MDLLTYDINCCIEHVKGKESDAHTHTPLHASVEPSAQTGTCQSCMISTGWRAHEGYPCVSGPQTYVWGFDTVAIYKVCGGCAATGVDQPVVHCGDQSRRVPCCYGFTSHGIRS